MANEERKRQWNKNATIHENARRFNLTYDACYKFCMRNKLKCAPNPNRGSGNKIKPVLIDFPILGLDKVLKIYAARRKQRRA